MVRHSSGSYFAQHIECLLDTPAAETPTREMSKSPEEGEDMDAENDDDAAMMAAMGLTSFGSTKVSSVPEELLDASAPIICTDHFFQGKHVLGNQEGAANIKKVRTWRQYMNRRGGFNRCASCLLVPALFNSPWFSFDRPLDKIK